MDNVFIVWYMLCSGYTVNIVKMEKLKAQVRFRMLKAGAHYVIDSIAELPGIIEIINQR